MLNLKRRSRKERSISIRVKEEDFQSWKSSISKTNISLTEAIELAMSDWCGRVEKLALKQGEGNDNI